SEFIRVLVRSLIEEFEGATVNQPLVRKVLARYSEDDRIAASARALFARAVDSPSRRRLPRSGDRRASWRRRAAPRCRRCPCTRALCPRDAAPRATATTASSQMVANSPAETTVNLIAPHLEKPCSDRSAIRSPSEDAGA